MILEGGIMSRGQAYIMEQMMVNFANASGFRPTDQGLPVPNGEYC